MSYTTVSEDQSRAKRKVNIRLAFIRLPETQLQMSENTLDQCVTHSRINTETVCSSGAFLSGTTRRRHVKYIVLEDFPNVYST